jgi:PKD domain
MPRLLAVLVMTAVPALLAEDKKASAKRPGLDLRATPRMAFSPADIFFTAELKGGDDNHEDLYCPEVTWEWGDGGKSVEESDCEPYTESAKIERRFTAHHTYPRAAVYSVKVTLRKSGKSVAAQTVQVTVRPGLGDRTMEN